MQPKATISFGPRRGPRTSTIHPWIGVNHHYHAKKPQRTVETLSARTKFDVVVVIVRILSAPAFLSI
jgi:hypothetical protein